MGERKYKIFISSVQKELETERVAVAGAVSCDRALSRHCDIVLFEKEPLSGRKVAKPYLECLAGCDAYILIWTGSMGAHRGLSPPPMRSIGMPRVATCP